MSEVIVEGYVLRPSDRHEGQWNVQNHKGESYGWVRPCPYWTDSWVYQCSGDTSPRYAATRDEAARTIVINGRGAAEAILSGSFFEGGAS